MLPLVREHSYSWTACVCLAHVCSILGPANLGRIPVRYQTYEVENKELILVLSCRNVQKSVDMYEMVRLLTQDKKYSAKCIFRDVLRQLTLQ